MTHTRRTTGKVASSRSLDIAWAISGNYGRGELSVLTGVADTTADRMIAVRRYAMEQMGLEGVQLLRRPWKAAFAQAVAHAQAAGVTRYWAKKRTPPEALPAPVVTAPAPVVTHAEPLSMSSLEIAELTGKEHKHVIRDIRRMLKELGDGPNLDHVREPKDSRGYTLRFDLPKDLTLTLVSGYNVQMRHRIITRWLELEDAAKAPQVPAIAAPRTLSEALFLAAKLAAEQEQRMVAA